MKWESVIPILVALLGIGSALVTGYLAGRRQARLDYQKEARLAVAQLAKSIGVAVHMISWFTWKAKHRGSLLAKKDAEDYDNAMKEIFPDLTGSLATLAAFSPAAYTRAKDIAKEIYSLDEKVADAATGLLTQDNQAPAALAILHEEVRRLETSSKETVTKLMEHIQ